MRRLLPVIGLIGMVGCGLRHALPPSPIFTSFRSVGPAVVPPPTGLLVWLEGETLAANASGMVTTWPDMRQTGPNQLSASRLTDGTVMGGTIAPASSLRNPDGVNRSGVVALRCPLTPRCSFALTNRARAPLSGVLTGSPYLIYAVVRRASGRGDNYFVMSSGAGCSPGAGGTGCTSNTALHLGWSDNGEIRLGQYDNDVHFPSESFNAAAPALSLLMARSGAGGKELALLEVLNQHRTSDDTRPLERSGTVFVGGTPWGDGNPVPDWKFEGDIFALLIYNVEQTDFERVAVVNYLRTRYGPPTR